MVGWISNAKRIGCVSFWGLAAFVAVTIGAAAQAPEELGAQRAAYDALEPKSIVALQPFRRTERAIRPASGEAIEFISLNPNISAWFLLTIGSGREARSYHLENPDPEGQSVSLRAGAAPELVITGRDQTVRCAPWDGHPPALEVAQATELPYAPICEERLYLRNRVAGSRTSLEKTTDFLRDRVWRGEAVVRFVKKKFFNDAHMETGDELGSADVTPGRGPTPAKLKMRGEQRPMIGTAHEFALDGTASDKMVEGIWYPVTDLAGVFVSAIQPRAISNDILDGPGQANKLDSVELKATDYLIAFSLSRFDLGFALGTDHPRLDWSQRAQPSVRVRGLPGPDGVASAAPLVTLGMVSPTNTSRTIATFTAGFKRQHGAFKWGPLSTMNFGSHYGFIEQGVILSKLQPGLSTLLVLSDGSVEMRTWRETDDVRLPHVRFARQNGVPLLETDPETGNGVPGDLVTAWGAGNWSGSADAELRTLRAGACMVETDATTYLIYGYFSTATPSAMARTFQAYGCRYAMMLDINALEHTYLALYIRHDGEVHVEHVVPEMGEVDRKDRRGNFAPRFLGYPDNRDLFYLTAKETPE